MTKESHLIFDPATLPESLEIDDSEILQEFYVEFLTQVDELKRTLARSGSAASNRSELIILAHKLKSSSQAVGAWQLSNCLKILEQAAINNTPELQAVFSTTQLLIDPTRAALLGEISRLRRDVS